MCCEHDAVKETRYRLQFEYTVTVCMFVGDGSYIQPLSSFRSNAGHCTATHGTETLTAGPDRPASGAGVRTESTSSDIADRLPVAYFSGELR